MKRDMDLARKILQAVESAGDAVHLDDLEKMNGISNYTDREVWYHVQLLDYAGYLDCLMTQSDDGRLRRGIVYGLTWDGQDFLDALRDDSVWEKTKRAVRESVGSTTFEVVKCVAVEASKRMALGALAGMF